MNQVINLGFITIGVGFFMMFILWSLVWKGWALWIAVKRDSKFWFVLLLVLNTVGILEILYIFHFSKKNTFKKMDHYADKTVENIKKTVTENFNLNSQEKKD
jgi:hypothetical protein